VRRRPSAWESGGIGFDFAAFRVDHAAEEGGFVAGGGGGHFLDLEPEDGLADLDAVAVVEDALAHL